MDYGKTIHITFEDGSNPYVHFDLSDEDLKYEVDSWNENYILTLVNTIATMVDGKLTPTIFFYGARERDPQNLQFV